MAKYRKRPVVIEAVQYNNLNKSEIESFVGKELKQELESETAYVAGKGRPIFSLTIETLEGNHKAMPNDYIIKGVKGEFYPCKPDIFEQTYEVLQEPEELKDFKVQCDACGKIYTNHAGSTPCCGSIAYMLDEGGNKISNIALNVRKTTFLGSVEQNHDN